MVMPFFFGLTRHHLGVYTVDVHHRKRRCVMPYNEYGGYDPNGRYLSPPVQHSPHPGDIRIGFRPTPLRIAIVAFVFIAFWTAGSWLPFFL